MANTNLSKPMRFLLRQMIENDPKDGMAESMLAYESEFFGGVKHEGSSFHLADKAADKTLAALERRGLITRKDGAWAVTAEGKNLVLGDSVCKCGHWFEEHSEQGCGACDECIDFEGSNEENSPSMIADRGGLPHDQPCNCNACRSERGEPLRTF